MFRRENRVSSLADVTSRSLIFHCVFHSLSPPRSPLGPRTRSTIYTTRVTDLPATSFIVPSPCQFSMSLFRVEHSSASQFGFAIETRWPTPGFSLSTSITEITHLGKIARYFPTGTYEP